MISNKVLRHIPTIHGYLFLSTLICLLFGCIIKKGSNVMETKIVRRDPVGLSEMVSIVQNTDSVFYLIQSMDGGKNTVPGPTDFELIAFIEPTNLKYIEYIKSQCLPYEGIQDGIPLDSNDAIVLFGNKIDLFNTLEDGRIFIKGWVFDAGPITKSPYSSNAVGVLIENVGICILASTS
jgi:hypothetical protein